MVAKRLICLFARMLPLPFTMMALLILPALSGTALAQPPSHQWTFDEPSGNANDSGSIGGIVGTVGSGATRVVGVTGNAIRLNGTLDSFVDFGRTVGQFGTVDFTVSFWVNTTETAQYFDLLGTRTDGTCGNYFSVRMTGYYPTGVGSGLISGELSEDYACSHYATVNSQPGYNDGRWHHVAVTRQGVTVTLYLDFVNVASFTSNGVANLLGANPFRVGRSYADFPDVSFSVDDLRIYDRALSAAEVAGLSSDLVAIQPPGWAGPVVARRTADATEANVAAPDTLLADSLSTYFDLGMESTVPDTATWGFSLALDGQPLAMGAATGKTPSGNINLGPYRVSGGRHTVTEVLDPAGLVVESNESNNRADAQWIWYPPALGRQSQSLHDAPPPAGGLAQPDCAAFSLARDLRYAWLVAARSEAAGDAYDFTCYDDYTDPRHGLVDLVKRTSLADRMTRFVVGDFRDDRTVLYPAFSDPAGTGPRAGYRLSVDDDPDRQTDAPLASWSGVLSATGALAHVYEGYFLAGAHYHIAVTRHDGIDPAKFEVFDPGTGFAHSIGEGVTSVDVPGTTTDSLEFVPTESAWHPIVVYAPQWAGDSLHYDFAWSQDQDLLATGTNPVHVNALDGPFPNPLVNGSRFEVNMARAGQVNLTAYDLSGRKCGTMWTGPLPAGRNTIGWSNSRAGFRLAPGVFWARLQGQGWESRRRFVILGP